MILLWQCSYCFFNKKSVVCFEMRAAQARGPPHTPPVPVRETRTQQLQVRGAGVARRSLFKNETKRRVLLLCLPTPSLPGRAVCASPFVLFLRASRTLIWLVCVCFASQAPTGQHRASSPGSIALLLPQWSGVGACGLYDYESRTQ